MAEITDDPNDRPSENATAIVEAGADAKDTGISGRPTPGREEQADQSGQDILIRPGQPANAAADPGMSHSGNTDWSYWSTVQANYGVHAGSVADGVTTALRAGHTWDEISQYLGEAQPIGNGKDQLVSKEIQRQHQSTVLEQIWQSGSWTP